MTIGLWVQGDKLHADQAAIRSTPEHRTAMAGGV
jgi:hypothetical protein